MKKSSLILFTFLLAFASALGADFRGFMSWFGRDASRARAVVECDVYPAINGLEIKLLRKADRAITVTGWVKFSYPRTNHTDEDRVIPEFLFSPFPVRRGHPDLLNGAGGYPNGQEISLPVTLPVAEPTLWPDSLGMVEHFPLGVFNCANFCSNSLTFSIGGETFEVEGMRMKNVKPKTKVTSVTVSGSPTGRFAVALTDGGRLYCADARSVNAGTSLYMLNPESTIGDDWVFLTFKVWIDGKTETTLSQKGTVWSGQTKENLDGVPEFFSTKGFYRLNFFSITGMKNRTRSVFDIRMFAEEVDARNVLRIRDNGAKELRRRGYNP